MKKISWKKRLQILEEYGIRQALAERCGGRWTPTSSLTGGYCSGGFCEMCGDRPDAPDFILHPHEDPPRSRGGKLSLSGSKMACNKCHAGAEGIKVVHSEPRWSKK